MFDNGSSHPSPQPSPLGRGEAEDVESSARFRRPYRLVACEPEDSPKMRHRARAHIVAIIAVVVIGVIVWFVADRRPAPGPDELKPATQPTTAPSTLPA